MEEALLFTNKLQEEQEEEWLFPVSPTGQYFNSSALSVCVLAVLDFEHPIDDSLAIPLIHNLFLPINPRFSSIMIIDEKGEKQWKKVEVRAEDHIRVPVFPPHSKSYDECFKDYLSEVAMEPLRQGMPLWEIHIVKYPTSAAAGNVIFKLHHALGDGFSLMGALLSCLQRADDPALPLTFPAFKEPSRVPGAGKDGPCKALPGLVSAVVNTVSDFGWSLMKSSFLEDDRTPIRSGDPGVEFRPVDINTIAFSIDEIKQIKTRLHVTINDVLCGVIFLGTRLYMEETSDGGGGGGGGELKNGKATALVLLNTRNIGGYRSTKEMVRSDGGDSSKWGNRFAFMHVAAPKSNSSFSNPIDFVSKAREIIQRKRNSSAVLLTGKVLDTLRHYSGPEATAKYVHNTLKNSSMTISNMIGPIEKMSLADQPLKGLYFMVVGVPQSLTITVMSYMRTLRIAVGTERGFIDAAKYEGCVRRAFHLISDAAAATAHCSIS
ncbi:unnamed protein product [Cuscuta campestris]|uniref:Uncharacterized protein n=1 Tax=Cuscuta campestris TaxID=132261 RepID=A0A484K7V0_9ASTE|nr:unnamed protein product [Cuscuta campestris]